MIGYTCKCAIINACLYCSALLKLLSESVSNESCAPNYVDVTMKVSDVDTVTHNCTQNYVRKYTW